MEPKTIRIDHCVFCFFLCVFCLFLGSVLLCVILWFYILMCSLFIYSSFQLQFLINLSWVLRWTPLMMGSWRSMWITKGRGWLWGKEVIKNHRGGRLWATECRWDPAQVYRVVTLPPCRVERATLLGVVQQQIVVVQCPLWQGLPVQISWYPDIPSPDDGY